MSHPATGSSGPRVAFMRYLPPVVVCFVLSSSGSTGQPGAAPSTAVATTPSYGFDSLVP